VPRRRLLRQPDAVGRRSAGLAGVAAPGDAVGLHTVESRPVRHPGVEAHRCATGGRTIWRRTRRRGSAPSALVDRRYLAVHFGRQRLLPAGRVGWPRGAGAARRPGRLRSADVRAGQPRPRRPGRQPDPDVASRRGLVSPGDRVAGRGPDPSAGRGRSGGFGGQHARSRLRDRGSSRRPSGLGPRRTRRDA